MTDRTMTNEKPRTETGAGEAATGEVGGSRGRDEVELVHSETNSVSPVIRASGGGRMKVQAYPDFR